MTEQPTQPTQRMGRIIDARGRSIPQLDPVKLHLLNLRSTIPPETLRSMTDEILPGAKRQRILQVVSVALGVLIVAGGNIIYFKYFSSWKGLDPVNMSIYLVQFLVILSGPLLAFRMARSKYLKQVASVMLTHQHCPHCGYDIRGLPRDPKDGATICPECGCAWILDNPGS